MKLLSLVVDAYVPEDERQKIEDHCTWDQARPSPPPPKISLTSGQTRRIVVE